jgi:hypothetical protein
MKTFLTCEECINLITGNTHDCLTGDEKPFKTLIELEEGDIVLTKSEREALAKELISHYVSYSHQEAREVVRKICYLVRTQEEKL